MNLDPFIGVILVWAILSFPVGVILGRRLKQAQPKQATKRETVQKPGFDNLPDTRH